MQEGGVPPMIAALTRNGVDERFLFNAFSTAVNTSRIPTRRMKDAIFDTLKKYADEPTKSNPFPQVSMKLQRVSINLFLKDIAVLVSECGPLPAIACSDAALASSFYLRLIDSKRGILITGKDPDLGSFPKGDLDTESKFLGDIDINDCTLQATGNLKKIVSHFGMAVIFAYPYHIERLFDEHPEEFDLDKHLFYDEEREGCPHSQQELTQLNKHKPKTAKVNNRTVQLAITSNGIVRTNKSTDNEPQLMSFVPVHQTISAIMKNLVLGKPTNNGFRPSLEFLAQYISISVNGSPRASPAAARATTARSSSMERVKKIREEKKHPVYKKMDAEHQFDDIPDGPNARKLMEDRVKEWSKSLQAIDEAELTAIKPPSPKNRKPRTPSKATTASKRKRGKPTASNVETNKDQASVEPIPKKKK